MDMEITSVVGWGRVKQFLEKLGKKPDSQVLSLSHCDLTATDIVELGEYTDINIFIAASFIVIIDYFVFFSPPSGLLLLRSRTHS